MIRKNRKQRYFNKWRYLSMNTIVLNNGVEMPALGFGVFQIPNEEECEQVVLDALKTGYRLLDTASVYQNERAVGNAIKKSGVPRAEIFLTTKAYIQEMGYENTKEAFYRSLEKLGVDYLDLYLIHQPFGDYYGSWRAMEELYKEGKIRSIGVSNFYPDRFIDFCYNVEVKPAINQVEMHPLFQQKELMELATEFGVQVEAWAPFAEGMQNIFENETLIVISKRHNKSTAQVMLRWNIQRGAIVIPKSVNKNRIEENFNVWDFELSKEEMELIAELDTDHNMILDPYSASEVKRVYNFDAQKGK